MHATITKYTTSPSRYEVLKLFLTEDPIFRNKVVRNYQSVGFSPEFINNVLLYSLGRPKVDMSKYLEDFQITPRYYPSEYLNLTLKFILSLLIYLMVYNKIHLYL